MGIGKGILGIEGFKLDRAFWQIYNKKLSCGLIRTRVDDSGYENGGAAAIPCRRGVLTQIAGEPLTDIETLGSNMAPVRATIEIVEILGLVLVLVAVDEPIAIWREGDVSFGVRKYFLRSQLPDDELSIDVVDDLASIHRSNHAIAIVPLGVAAEKVL